MSEQLTLDSVQKLSNFQKLVIAGSFAFFATISVYLLAFGTDSLDAMAMEKLDLQREWHDLDHQKTAAQDAIDRLQATIDTLDSDMATLHTNADEIEAQIQTQLSGF